MSLPHRSLPVDARERRRLPVLLRRAWYGLNQAFRRRIAHAGATPDQFTVLRTIIEVPGPGISQRELAQLICSDPNTIASLLERMEKAGWIERPAHETDRRARRVRLLPAGRRKYSQLRKIAVKLQTHLLTTLPETQREPFLEQLERVADACRDAAPNPKSPRGH